MANLKSEMQVRITNLVEVKRRTAITVFDEMIVMRDEDGYKGVGETLDNLEEMLTAYGIPHAFTFPHEATLKEHPNAAITLNYESENHLTVSLIYALYIKQYRGVENERVAKALVKVASHYIEEF